MEFFSELEQLALALIISYNLYWHIITFYSPRLMLELTILLNWYHSCDPLLCSCQGGSHFLASKWMILNLMGSLHLIKIFLGIWLNTYYIQPFLRGTRNFQICWSSRILLVDSHFGCRNQDALISYSLSKMILSRNLFHIFFQTQVFLFDIIIDRIIHRFR